MVGPKMEILQMPLHRRLTALLSMSYILILSGWDNASLLRGQSQKISSRQVHLLCFYSTAQHKNDLRKCTM